MDNVVVDTGFTNSRHFGWPFLDLHFLVARVYPIRMVDKIMPFQPGNKCACRKEKLDPEEIRRRKRERARVYRETHSYDHKKRKERYLRDKLKMIAKAFKGIKSEDENGKKKSV